ncbi:MAG TPA: response regulator transcription factor [Blastocatellia bacterium]|nr:response regulator transcription factor [Blastocatellia bacterium]
MDSILIFDDDRDLCTQVTQTLGPQGFGVRAVEQVESAVECALAGDYALLLLAVIVSGANGFKVLHRIRAESRIPILMLAPPAGEFEGILGLELGADDYLSKPLNLRELAARVRAILRRSRNEQHSLLPPAPLTAGDLELDARARIARRAGLKLQLTTVEFDLLQVFLRTAGQVVSREKLVGSVLGRSFDPLDRSIDMHVSNLRKKLNGPAKGTDAIKAVRGVGYIFTIK